MHVLSVIFQPPPHNKPNLYAAVYHLGLAELSIDPYEKNFFICQFSFMSGKLEFRLVICRQLFTTSDIQIGSSSQKWLFRSL